MHRATLLKIYEKECELERKLAAFPVEREPYHISFRELCFAEAELEMGPLSEETKHSLQAQCDKLMEDDYNEIYTPLLECRRALNCGVEGLKPQSGETLIPVWRFRTADYQRSPTRASEYSRVIADFYFSAINSAGYTAQIAYEPNPEVWVVCAFLAHNIDAQILRKNPPLTRDALVTQCLKRDLDPLVVDPWLPIQLVRRATVAAR